MNRLTQFLGYSEDRKDNWFLFGMQLFVFTLPAYWAFVNSWSVVVLIIIWAFTQNFQGFWKRFRTRKIGWAFLLYFLWILISLSYSENSELGWLNLGQKLTFLVFPFVLLSSPTLVCRHVRGVVRVFYWTLFVLSIIMLMLAGYKYYFNPQESLLALDYFTYERLAYNVGIQPIYLSMYMVFSFFAVWWDYFLHPKIGLTRSGKWMARIWLFHFFMMTILLSSRMGLLILLTLTAGLLLWLAYLKREKWSFALAKIAILFSLTLILIGMIPINKMRYAEMVDFEKDYTENKWGGRAIRVQKWLNTLELIAEQPLLGTGAGDMQNELQKVYKRNNFKLAYIHRFNPHNQFLQTWATLGLIGLFFLLAIFVLAFLNAFHFNNYLYTLTLFILAFSMITESILERHKGVVFFSFFVLLFNAYYYNHKKLQETSP
jgi:O-antigen ligase